MGEGAGTRIVVVGDSYTFGHGVERESTFPSLLASELAAHDVAVVAYSRSGWNTRREQIALEDDFDRLAPEVLILAYCLNDAEPRSTGRMLSERADLLPWRPEGRLESLLVRHSLLFRRAALQLDAIRLRPRLREYYHGLYRNPENLAVWLRALDRIERLASRRRVPVVLVVFPIFDSDLDSDYSYRDLHERVTTVGRERGFEVLDLLPFYADTPGRELSLVPFTDPHPNRLAHAIAAREIARFLERRDLLSDASRELPT